MTAVVKRTSVTTTTLETPDGLKSLSVRQNADGDMVVTIVDRTYDRSWQNASFTVPIEEWVSLT